MSKIISGCLILTWGLEVSDFVARSSSISSSRYRLLVAVRIELNPEGNGLGCKVRIEHIVRDPSHKGRVLTAKGCSVRIRSRVNSSFAATKRFPNDCIISSLDGSRKHKAVEDSVTFGVVLSICTAARLLNYCFRIFAAELDICCCVCAPANFAVPSFPP